MKTGSTLTPSSKRLGCPICNRTKDGDCRIGDQLILCHYGSSHHPPQHLKPGDVHPGHDGQKWAYTGDTSDGRQATFTLHKPRQQPQRPEPPIKSAESVWHYSTDFLVCRFPGKKIRPLWWDGSAWRWKAPPAPRPLLNLDQLRSRTGTVLIVEGEKAADAAAKLYPKAIVTSWPSGCKAIDKADWSPLQGRRIILWPDADQPGRLAMDRLAQLLLRLPVDRVQIVAPPADASEGWDLADATWTPEEAAAYIKANVSEALQLDPEAEPVLTAAEPEPTRSEIEQRTYSELLGAMLLATIAGDDDELMQLRAETIARFRRTDAQIEAALFKLHTQQEIGSNAKAEPESLDLSRISGMDWLIEGFIPYNDLTLLWGNAGSGKTTAALAAASSVLFGAGLLDHSQPAPIGSVLFIASDSGAPPLYAAMQDMGMADRPELQDGPQKRLHVWASDPDQGMTAWAADLRGCIRLLEFIKQHGIRLVLIDSCKAVCSGAGLDYSNNQLVTALLTYFKEVICPNAAVVWLNHDGTAKGAAAGAKAWKEIPSMVHSIIREENKDGSFMNSRRLWRVMKSRMGTTREFYYELNQGDLKLCPNQEKVGNCLDRVVDVLMGAWQLEGQQSLSRADLQERICMAGGPSRKTLDNTLTTATRAKHPEVCRASRGRYRLAPRIADSLKGCILNGKEQGQNPVIERDLSSSRQVPMGTSGKSENFPVGINGKLPNPSAGLRSGHVPSRNACTPYQEVAIPGMELVELKRAPVAAEHPSLTTVTERVTAAMASVGSDQEQILKWCADRNLALSTSECQRTLRRLASNPEQVRPVGATNPALNCTN